MKNGKEEREEIPRDRSLLEMLASTSEFDGSARANRSLPNEAKQREGEPTP
jgi:hypothetical protein